MLYTTTFPVYLLVTTIILYWIITNASATERTWPACSLLHFLLPFTTNHNLLYIHFTQMPLLSMLTFSSFSLLVRSCSVSPITTESSTYNNSHGKVTLNCLDNASMTVKHNIQWNIFSSIKWPTTSAVSLESTAITSENATSMTIDQCTAAEHRWKRIQSYYCKPISAT